MFDMSRLNRYDRKRITQRKMKKLHDNNCYFVYLKDDNKGGKYYQPLYLSGCRKYAKRRTNRILRKSMNDFNLRGCAYRRKFDYWYTLF